MNGYGLSQTLYLAGCLLRTRLFFPGSRLIRFPIAIRGKKNIFFGRNLTTGRHCRLEALGKGKTIVFGKNIEINDNVHITGFFSVTLGDNVLLASKVYISDTSHGTYSGEQLHSSPDTPPNDRVLHYDPVSIGDNVWIGEAASILPGVTIGNGAVIGAHSVVTKSIPANCIAVGAPAAVIKEYNSASKRWEPLSGGR